MWLTFADLRGRPLPGSTTSSTSKVDSNGDLPGSYLGLAIDLRQNCKDLQKQLPAKYFGNAAWCLHINSNSSCCCSSKPSTGSTAKNSNISTNNIYLQSSCKGFGTAAGEVGEQSAACSYTRPLQIAAGAVRGGLMNFRGVPDAGSDLLQLVTEQQAASKRVLVSARLHADFWRAWVTLNAPTSVCSVPLALHPSWPSRRNAEDIMPLTAAFGQSQGLHALGLNTRQLHILLQQYHR